MIYLEHHCTVAGQLGFSPNFPTLIHKTMYYSFFMMSIESKIYSFSSKYFIIINDETGFASIAERKNSHY